MTSLQCRDRVSQSKFLKQYRVTRILIWGQVHPQLSQFTNEQPTLFKIHEELCNGVLTIFTFRRKLRIKVNIYKTFLLSL